MKSIGVLVAMAVLLVSVSVVSIPDVQVDAHKDKSKTKGLAACAFNPDKLDQCKPDSNGNCPKGFSHNESGNCFPSGPCPTGFFRKTDDESGKCFPDHNTKDRLKCDDVKDQCIGFCSTGKVDGVETTFCFTKKACENFREDHDGTKCKRTVIHD